MLWWSRHRSRSFPWRETTDPWEVLVGEVLLQRTRAENVSAFYDRLMARWPTVRIAGICLFKMGVRSRVRVLVDGLAVCRLDAVGVADVVQDEEDLLLTLV